MTVDISAESDSDIPVRAARALSLVLNEGRPVEPIAIADEVSHRANIPYSEAVILTLGKLSRR